MDSGRVSSPERPELNVTGGAVIVTRFEDETDEHRRSDSPANQRRQLSTRPGNATASGDGHQQPPRPDGRHRSAGATPALRAPAEPAGCRSARTLRLGGPEPHPEPGRDPDVDGPGMTVVRRSATPVRPRSAMRASHGGQRARGGGSMPCRGGQQAGRRACTGCCLRQRATLNQQQQHDQVLPARHTDDQWQHPPARTSAGLGAGDGASQTADD